MKEIKNYQVLKINIMSIAALITCHNRCEKTKRCLSSLLTVMPELKVYLVDDGSTDGTSEMVNTLFPGVTVLKGDGNLFWSRGMYIAWKEAVKRNYDYYLWINDDIILHDDFFDELKSCLDITGKQSIIVGLIEDKDGNCLYGGHDKQKRQIVPNGVPQEIWLMNGNVVLITKEVVKKIGIIDPRLHHAGADTDYGLTACENGIGVFSTRKYIALGYPNDIHRLRQPGVSIIKRFKHLYSPLGIEPSIAFYLRKKHFGFFNAMLYWAYIHIINILPDGCVAKKF